ncbi:UNVERIFIED_CONTAM: Secoisolariciresinol dehydrogenase [Sesamum radiatum]|uniref:Secoisolariciresinol dehydrogenase n=1 Tax=Sesamum radiatum TaxID=300843 RepID=A0AAW2KUY0_SESRA
MENTYESKMESRAKMDSIVRTKDIREGIVGVLLSWFTPTAEQFKTSCSLISQVKSDGIPLRKARRKGSTDHGGARGLGEATAKLFAKHGAKVIIADIQDERGHAICKEFPSISYVHCDVTKESDVKSAVDGAVSQHGRLDIMFNNAGITVPMQYSSVLDSEKSHFEKVFDVNVFGAFLGAKHAARVMIPAKKGSIIFTSSVSAVTALEFPISYASSKHAVIGLTNQLCLELGKHGIRVNCISPFLIPTPMLADAMGDAVDMKTAAEWVAASATLKGPPAEADDIAEAAIFLGSDESKYVSGLNLVVDGGYSKVNPTITSAMRGVRI